MQQTEDAIIECMMDLMEKNAMAMPGVYEVIRHFENKHIKMAVASASPMKLIKTVLTKLDIINQFDVIWSAEFESHGKPHPGIFISTANKLGIKTHKCVVFEDSINGVLAAKAARMYCVAVPEKATFNDPRFAIADLKIQSLLDYPSAISST